MVIESGNRYGRTRDRQRRHPRDEETGKEWYEESIPIAKRQ